MMRRTLHCIVGLALALTLTGCVNHTVKSTSVPAIETASTAVPEGQLLDVGIAVFDPGLDDYDEGQQIYPEVRKAEARYMPNLLAEAMQNSGAWGAVRVMPGEASITDLVVEGTILASNGEELQLMITATDSTGRVWLNRKYTGNASRYAYNSTTRTVYDPFQAVYNTIANDLLKQQEALAGQDREKIRTVTELLFAQDFSEEAFAGYLNKSRRGEYQIQRLPAEEDPMLERVRSIRERDLVFIDTLQDYYGSFNGQMYGPYQEWRKLSYEETIALQELRAESTRRLIAGGIAVLAGVAAAGGGDSATRTAGNVAVIGGGYLLKSGLEKRAEAEIHVQALEELGLSLEAEITPSVIELEDRTVMLSGNVEDQYDQWRELLAEIYRAEIGELALPEANQADNSSAQ
ncbi:hypothetical protein [Parahalioglobus pacificus]|uniref:Curli production assembly/transport component CsgG n=1 Tax=Parahalioglobus pacificus TaxID=930806 RepID=A0A919CM31_9GAMM|nr:hypothetical protein [Halioglobus pacificus]GHD39038.1 hypothetical protein GCM10007053_30190 [Halioglobus pacificus]